MLYGDDISKHVKEIQDVNKIGTRIKGAIQSGYGYQNRGRGSRFRGIYRGHITKPWKGLYSFKTKKNSWK